MTKINYAQIRLWKASCWKFASSSPCPSPWLLHSWQASSIGSSALSRSSWQLMRWFRRLTHFLLTTLTPSSFFKWSRSFFHDEFSCGISISCWIGLWTFICEERRKPSELAAFLGRKLWAQAENAGIWYQPRFWSCVSNKVFSMIFSGSSEEIAMKLLLSLRSSTYQSDAFGCHITCTSAPIFYTFAHIELCAWLRRTFNNSHRTLSGNLTNFQNQVHTKGNILKP